MNRSEFLKRLGIGTATIVVAPHILAEKPKEKSSVFVGNEKIVDAVTHTIDTHSPNKLIGENYALLLKDNEVVAILHEFVCSIERDLVNVTKVGDPWPQYKQGLLSGTFTGKTNCDFLNQYFDDLLHLRFMYSGDAALEADVIITSYMIETPMHGESNCVLEMSLSGALTMNELME